MLGNQVHAQTVDTRPFSLIFRMEGLYLVHETTPTLHAHSQTETQELHTNLAIPTWLAPPHRRPIHDVISHQEESL